MNEKKQSLDLSARNDGFSSIVSSQMTFQTNSSREGFSVIFFFMANRTCKLYCK